MAKAKPIDASELKIVYKAPQDLIPNPRNARTHSESQIVLLVSLMGQFGFTNPVLTRGNDIIAGHGRTLAAMRKGLGAIPTIDLNYLTADQARALIIADNRSAEDAVGAGWDLPTLALEFKALEEAGFDLDLTGFDIDARQDIVGEETEKDEEIPETPAIPVSAEQASFDRLLDGEADMVFTDPPYNVNYDLIKKDRLPGPTRVILNDNLGGVEFRQFLVGAFTPMLAACRGAIYIAMSSSELDTLHGAFKEAGGHWSTFVIWAKNTFTMGRADYQRQYEPILYGWREGATRHWCGDRSQGDIWAIKRQQVNDLHPTMKPVELVERAIRNSSRPRDTVLDPFGGSGTTIIAAEKLQRFARVIELDPKYVDIIVRRWEDFTGHSATLDETGQTFREVQEDRATAV